MVLTDPYSTYEITGNSDFTNDKTSTVTVKVKSEDEKVTNTYTFNVTKVVSTDSSLKEFKLGDYEFGADNRKVTINEENKLIYPNLSSVKGFGEGVVDTLYELGQKEYETFTDVLTALFSNSINKTIVNKLIRINYFKKYGDVNTLLEITRYYDLLNGAKQIAKDKAEKNNLCLLYTSDAADD